MRSVNMRDLSDVSISENPRNEEFERVKQERDLLLEERNDYGTEYKNLEKTLKDKKIAINAMKLSLTSLKRSLIFLEAEKSLSMKVNEEFLFHPSQISASKNQITHKFLKNILPLYSQFSFKVEKAFLKYCNREVLQLVPFIPDLRKNWKQRVRRWRSWEFAEKISRYWRIRSCFLKADYVCSIRSPL